MSSAKRSRWDEDSDDSTTKKSKENKKSSKKSKKDKDGKRSSSKTVESVSDSISLQATTLEVQPVIPVADLASNAAQPSSSTLLYPSIAAINVPISSSSSSSRRRFGLKPLESNTPCRSVENYERINFIDQGTYGLVFKGRCIETNEIYALKQVKLGPEVTKVGFPITAFREVNILMALSHPNIIKVREMVVGSTIDKIYMVMEYCENDLKTCMKQNKQSFSIAEMKQLMRQLLSAVDHMHSHYFIHRDLKTSNLLYSNKGYLSICDFGMARKFELPTTRAYTFEVVTLWYRCPEVLLGQRIYSSPLDLWSVGCIFAELLLGDPLFPGQGEPDQISRIFRTIGAPTEQRWPGFASLPRASHLGWKLPTKNKLRELFPQISFSGMLPLSDLGLDLMNRLLDMNPATRITAAEALEHAWLTTEMPRPTQPELMPVFRSRNE